MIRRLLRAVGSVIGADEQTRVHECRHCGCAVDAETDACPDCGREEIAQYDLS